MKQTKLILIFIILACIPLTFYLTKKERASKESTIPVQKQKQEEVKEEIKEKPEEAKEEIKEKPEEAKEETKEEPATATEAEYSYRHVPASYIKSFKVYKTIDTSKDSTEYAKNAMLEYLAGEENMTVKEYLEKYKEDEPDKRVRGFEVNLNNYGKNEVIGVREYGCAVITCTGEIIQKQNGKWVDLGYIEFGPSSKIEILQNKTNGYHDIRTLPARYCGGGFEVPCYPEIKRFKNGGYRYSIYAKEVLDARNKLQ